MLVNLNENDVLDINDNIQRFNDFKSKDADLQEILLRNAVSISGQENILNKFISDLSNPSNRELMLWSKIDGKLYQRLVYLFDLCWENLSTSEERKSFGSKGGVVNKIDGSCYRTSINEMIEKELEFKAKKLADEKGIKYKSINTVLRNG